MPLPPPPFELFYGEGRHDLSDRGCPYRAGNAIMVSQSGIDTSRPNTGTFNDMEFYLSLLDQPGCLRVDLAEVYVLRNSYVQGIQGVYRCRWKNGSITYPRGDCHMFVHGYYGRNGGGLLNPRHHVLEPGEVFLGVATRQGEILDGLRMITSNRERTLDSQYAGGWWLRRRTGA